MNKQIQVHYAVVVEMTVDEDGTILDIHKPYIDAEVAVGNNGDDTWDVTEEKWYRADEYEWDAGAGIIRLAADRSQALAEIHAILDGTEWSADTNQAVADVLTKYGYALTDYNPAAL